MALLLTDLLPAEHIIVPLRGPSFHDAVRQLADRIAESGAIREGASIDRQLAAPRGRDVVAIGPDIALPHFRTDAVDHLVLALGIARQPLDITETALTSSPRIVALVLAPPEAATRYLQTVAALARLFRDPAVVERIASAASAEEILAMPELGRTSIQPDLRVRDVMSHRTEAVAPGATVREAVEIMLKRGLKALPVVSDTGQVLGILSERDVMRALLPEFPRAGEPATQTQPVLVRDVMTRTVLCVSEDQALEEVANMMVNKKLEQFPVVNESVLAGMLTRSDIIRKLFGR